MHRLLRDVAFGDLPCFGFGAAQCDEFGHIGLALGEELMRGYLGIGIGLFALIGLRIADVHPHLVFVGAGCTARGDDDS